uniref:Uncharacterized protein n=1 Tax=Echinococcus granulosus TaxID=6210 RepID=A0A068WY69_ECHGR|nr:hypothetical protein EgrG_002041000 [Echinococcus granulosus]
MRGATTSSNDYESFFFYFFFFLSIFSFLFFLLVFLHILNGKAPCALDYWPADSLNRDAQWPSYFNSALVRQKEYNLKVKPQGGLRFRRGGKGRVEEEEEEEEEALSHVIVCNV